jgi:anti-sigma factor RsiW
MKCKEIKWMLALYGSGELSPEEQEIVETHLAACGKCRQELAHISKVPELIQSLKGETWWADVSSSVKEHITTGREKPGGIKEKDITTGITAWRPARIGSLATTIIERPIWQRVLVSALAIIVIAATSLVIIRPWGDNNITQLAVDTAQNNHQVQALLGERVPESEVENMGGVALVKFATENIIVSAVVDVETLRVMAIQREVLTFLLAAPPSDRPELTIDEKEEAVAIAMDDQYVQVFLSHGLTLGEVNSWHPALGEDTKRVAWLPLEGMMIDEYSGVIVNLDDPQDVTVMWGGELPEWWPFIQ